MNKEVRKIITIDEELCDGCGICVDACHEGAIALIEGKAKLMYENYCDGLGDCLPACPTGAITFEEREAAAYDEAAVIANQMAQAKAEQSTKPLPCGCPGSEARALDVEEAPHSAEEVPSQLRQWPIQIKLVPVDAPYFAGADLLIAADCAAFTYGNFHQDYMRGKITLIGCPKLDGVDYAEKLKEIIGRNDIRSLSVARMSVPCCSGIEQATKRALEASGKTIPLEVVTISTDGTIL